MNIQDETDIAHQRLTDPQLRAYIAGLADDQVKPALVDLLGRVSPELVVTDVLFGRRPLRSVTVTWAHSANGILQRDFIDGAGFL